MEFLETKDVSPHMAKRKVDCAQIVKDIRKEYDDIVWVSASIDGSRLRIQIKENEDTFREEAESADGAGAEGQGDASLDAGKGNGDAQRSDSHKGWRDHQHYYKIRNSSRFMWATPWRKGMYL